MIVQVVLLREFMAVYYGNELSIGLVLTSWLLWVAVGSWVGNLFLVSEKPAAQALFSIMQSLTFLAAGLAIVLIKHVRIILGIPYGEFISFPQLAFFSFLILSAPCFLIGFQFSFLAGLIAQQAASEGNTSARVYIYESFGSMLASLLMSFLIVHWLSNLTGLIVLGGAVFVALALIDRLKKIWTLVLICVIALLTLASFHVETRLVRSYWQSLGRGIRLLDWKHSRFGELAVIDWAGEKSLYANGIKVTDLPDPIGTQALASLLMNQHPDPKTVLLISGSLGGLAPELARYPGSEITCLELDAAAFRLAQAHLDSQNLAQWRVANLKVLHLDGRFYLRRHNRPFDLIIVNVGRPASAIANRLYTQEFFHLAAEKLTEGGILALCNVPSSAEYLSDELLQLNSAIYGALEKEFQEILILPADEAIFFAANRKGLLVSSSDSLAERYLRNAVRCTYFFPEMFSQYMRPDRIEYIRKALHQAELPRINRDWNPISYFSDFVIWNKLTHGRSHLLSKLSRIGAVEFALPVFLIALIWLGLTLRFRQKRRVVSFGIITITAIVGFAGIALNVLLILAYQTIFGYLYEMIGLALAAFMSGMAIAGMAVNRFLTKLRRRFLLGAILLLIALTAMALPRILVVLQDWSSHFLILALLLWTGALTGGAFPLLCHFYASVMVRTRVGSIYAADLCGGSLGSILITGLMVPLLGFASTLTIIAMLGMAGLIFVMIIPGNF